MSTVNPQPLATDLEHFAARITALESGLAEVQTALANRAAGTNRGVLADIEKEHVLAVTRAIFHGEPSFEVDFDPADPDYRYLLVVVHAQGEPPALVQQRLEWHEQIAQLKLTADLRLLIVPT